MAVAVVGGGIAGVAAARVLSRQGHAWPFENTSE